MGSYPRSSMGVPWMDRGAAWLVRLCSKVPRSSLVSWYTLMTCNDHLIIVVTWLRLSRTSFPDHAFNSVVYLWFYCSGLSWCQKGWLHFKVLLPDFLTFTKLGLLYGHPVNVVSSLSFSVPLVFLYLVVYKMKYTQDPNISLASISLSMFNFLAVNF